MNAWIDWALSAWMAEAALQAAMNDEWLWCFGLLFLSAGNAMMAISIWKANDATTNKSG